MEEYPWIKFELDTRRFPYGLWFRLGQCVSKCRHIRRVPLLPELRKRLHQVYLAKGVHATTAIEGNTLSEQQVMDAIEGKLKVEDSRKYLQQEVENILEACNDIAQGLVKDEYLELTPDMLCGFNAMVLKDVPCDDGVVPGELRKYRVGVGPYRAPAAGDVRVLIEEFCKWINGIKSKDVPQVDSVALSIAKAILAHVYIAWIHPFGDGNGRTARLVEFAILLGAGVPSPAAHLLSNHYNATRSEYYRQLDRTSKSGGDLIAFFEYAINGFYDGLNEVIGYLIRQVEIISWEHYIFEYYRELPSKDSNKRQRNVVLAISRQPEPISKDKLEELTAKIYLDSKKMKNTFTRDLNSILKTGLVVEDGGLYRPDLDPIVKRLPFSV